MTAAENSSVNATAAFTRAAHTIAATLNTRTVVFMGVTGEARDPHDPTFWRGD